MAGAFEAMVDGRRISGLEAGEAGPRLVFLHGFGSDRMSWFLNQTDAASYARTLALDLPGHGASDRDVGDGTVFTIAGRVARVLDELGDGPVHLAGHSFGGATALVLAQSRPDLVRSLTLVAPAGVGARVNAGFLSAFTGMTNADEAMAALTLLVDRPRLISRQMAARVLEGINLPGARAALQIVAEALATLPADLDPVVARIGAGTIPRQVIWGEGDRVSPPNPDRIARLNAPVTWVPGAGHLPHMEAAALVNGLIRQMVAGT